jgi:hypothetical protein
MNSIYDGSATDGAGKKEYVGYNELNKESLST